MEDKANGHSRGRAVPPIPEYTFQDTGITVRLRKLSPLLRDDIDTDLRRRFPQPVPPIVETELGKEENAADPDYRERLARWSIEHVERLGEEWFRAIVELAIECEVDTEAVEKVRAYAKRRGLRLDDDDKYVFVRHVCIATKEDIADLRETVTRRSLPTQEAVDAHKATFRGDAPGA